MNPEVKELWKKIREGVIDVNNQDLFFGILSKAFLYNINQKLTLRGTPIPHYILNTGHNIMYLEIKGQDHSIERPIISGQTPVVSNENFMYSQIPRCMVQPAGINIQTDQLTSPYSYGRFEVEVEDMIYIFRSEFRRIPVVVSYSLKYYLDSFSDAISVSQQLINKLAFINNFDFTYLGNVLKASYMLPSDINTEFQIEFDGLTQDSKNRTISLDMEVSTNIPIIYPETIIPADNYIKGFVVGKPGDPVGSTSFGIYQKGGIAKAAAGEDVPVDYSGKHTIKLKQE